MYLEHTWARHPLICVHKGLGSVDKTAEQMSEGGIEVGRDNGLCLVCRHQLHRRVDSKEE